MNKFYINLNGYYMLFISYLFLFTMTLTVAMKPDIKSSTKPSTNFKFNGDTQPLGFFDPLKLTSNMDESLIKYTREAELQHGRIAMLSSLALPIVDIYNKAVGSSDLAIYKLSSSPIITQSLFFMIITFIEYSRIKMNYQDPFSGEKSFKLKQDVEPGRYLFFTEPSDRLTNVELNNGRLAMIGVIGYIVQELVTSRQVIFDNFPS